LSHVKLLIICFGPTKAIAYYLVQYCGTPADKNKM
jgi:hypothetical protein